MSAAPDSIAERVRSEIDRALQRNIKGLDYLGSRGPALGQTPRDLIHQRGTLALYHYRPLVEEIYRVPLLLVMAVTNRGYILDLAPGQSLVEFLLRQGYDVFVIDWNPPRDDEKGLRLEDYTLDFIPDSIRRVQQATGEEDVTLVGYCMGGVLSTIYTALHPKGPVKNLVVFTTPIDFSEMKLFSKWSDKRYFDVDRIVDTMGNAPSDMIYAGFDALRPADRIAGQVQLWDNLWNDEFVKSYRMFDRWATDVLPLPGEFFRQVTKEFMWDNRLHRNELTHRRPARGAQEHHDALVPRHRAARPHRAVRRRPAAGGAGRLQRQGRDRSQGRPRQRGGRGQRGQAAVARTRCMAGKAFDMSIDNTHTRSYPRSVASPQGDIALRLLTPDDEAAVLAFAQELSTHDLLFLRRDISQPKVVAAWMDATRRGTIVTVLATREGAVLGCATIVRDDLSWSRHVGELRVMVLPLRCAARSWARSSRRKALRVALDMGLEKLMAQMTVDQRGAIAVFEGLGFKPEALLRDHVKDREGRKHDIVILSHDVAHFHAQMAAYGLTEAF